MQVEPKSQLFSGGFSFISKAGLHLFVNCNTRKAYLSCSCVENDKATFWFLDEVDNDHEIVFHFETDHERELLKDTQRFDCQCKDQFEFLFVKFDDLKEREE